MTHDDDQSLGDQNTFNSEGRDERDAGPESLGDEMTFAGGGGLGEPQSLGDEATFGGDTGSVDDGFDDDMEIVDLAARYTTEGMLGKGGMGEVLLATDTRLNRKVAIKRILGSAARSKTAVSRFLTEAQSIAALNHPNIVQIYDYGRAKDGPFLIMEFVEGSSLLDKCREGPIALEEAIDLTCQLCDGLSKAHAANIVHRDIKPANVLLTEDGVPKLTDFGLAKDEAADTGMTMAGAVLGTLDFMPPEQRKDAALTDNRSDLWSLAATLYQMVTGKSPKIIKFNDVPKTLQDVLGKALEDSKDDRYQNALQLKEALQESLKAGPDAYVELDQGECPHCGTKNDANRKFCRNPDCGGSLEVTCMSCSESIPMWEAVCGSCGAKQADLVDERREQMAEQKHEAEELLAGQDYNRALSLAGELGSESDLRLQHLKHWANEFVADVEQERERELTHVRELFSEALKHEEAFDDAAGIKTLMQVAEPLREETLSGHDENVATLLRRLTQRQKKAGDLEKQIQLKVKSRQLANVPSLVDALLKIRPHREDVRKLQKQLSDRSEKLQRVRDESYEKATSLLEQQDYLRCLNVLKKVDASLVDKDIEELRQKAQAKNTRMAELDTQIRNALAAKQFDGLFGVVEEYLFLQKSDAEMQQLREQLIARDKKQATQIAELIEKAKGLRNQCKFDSALNVLSSIPQTQLKGEAHSLSHECTDLQYQRSQAIAALNRGVNENSLSGAVRAASGYSSRLNQDTRLQDSEFSTLYAQCQAELKNQIQLAEVTERAKAAKRKVMAIGGISATIVVVLVVVFISYSISKANQLADAIASQRWGEVLELDPDNVPALVGQAKQQLVGSQPDLKAIAAHLARAEKLDPSYGDMSSAKGQLYKAEAIQAAEAGDLAKADSKLREFEALNIKATAERVRKTLAVAYAKSADVAMSSGNTALAILEGQKAIAYDAEIKLPGAVQVAAMQAAREKAAEAVSGAVNGFMGQPGDRTREKLLSAIVKLEALSGDSSANDAAGVELVPLLVSRCKDAFARQDYAGFVGDYALLSRLNPKEGEQFGDRVANLPVSVLGSLPVSVLTSLPPTRNSIGMDLKWLPAGVVQDGITGLRVGEGKGPGNSISKQVTLKMPFMLGVHEVTQEQYEQVMGDNPSLFKGDKNPVENVSWEDAVEFCRKLSALPSERAAGRVYRLPTEAEWKHGCRAGTTTAYSFGDDRTDLGQYAWYYGNADKTTHAVGGKQPNSWGLYDMHGNVWEQVQDSDRADRTYAVLGGSWREGDSSGISFLSRSSLPFRGNTFGFRVCLSPSDK